MKYGFWNFNVFENAKIEINGEQTDLLNTKTNHKFGDTSRPDVGAGLGSPSVLVEEPAVDPYDNTRPAQLILTQQHLEF